MKRQIIVKHSEVINYACRDMVMNDLNVVSATGRALELCALKSRLMKNKEIVKIAYQKLNGEIRIALATLHPDICKANINGNGIPKKYYGMFVYWDIERNGFRAFKFERYIGTVEN